MTLGQREQPLQRSCSTRPLWLTHARRKQYISQFQKWGFTKYGNDRMQQFQPIHAPARMPIEEPLEDDEPSEADSSDTAQPDALPDDATMRDEVESPAHSSDSDEHIGCDSPKAELADAKPSKSSCFFCWHCDASFDRAYRLRHHLADIHSEEPAISCVACQMTFTDIFGSFDLLEHENEHDVRVLAGQRGLFDYSQNPTVEYELFETITNERMAFLNSQPLRNPMQTESRKSSWQSSGLQETLYSGANRSDDWYGGPLYSFTYTYRMTQEYSCRTGHFLVARTLYPT